jgi:TolB-like protein
MESFGHYTILERLRVGALGELLRARDTRLGRTVALRIVSPVIAAFDERLAALLADASAATELSHPHIAALFDFGEEDGRVFLAHEYVPGQSLRAHMTGKPIDASLALEFAVQLADAIADGHRQGLVHGNLSPSTIFITPTDQTKIIGFGLSAWTSGGIERKTIAEQLAAGQEPPTPGANEIVPYMSPEQLLTGRVDPRSDVFSLGVVLYEMLTGRAPFGSDTAGATALKVLQGTPPPPTRKNPSLPRGFDPILARAMAKSLDTRYPTASAMAADLRALADQLHVRVTAAIPLWTMEKPARPRGPMLKRISLALLLLALLGAAAAGAWFWRDRIAALFSGGAAVPRPVLLVMPFQMAGSESARAYYGIGFAEDLAARLGEVPGLTVVGRSSIAEMPAPTLTERASRAGATVALRGTIRPGPYSLHVDVELVEVATGRVIWSEKYAREPRQASAAEVEIARQVADELRLGMPTGNRWARAQVRQVDPGAYDLYLQARDAAAHRDQRRAIELFRQAIDMDPKLVEARAGLSETVYLEGSYSGSNGDAATLANAREEAEAALAADPDMPRALVAAALSATTITGAASSLARALSLDPSYGDAWHHAGDLVVELDPTRAIACYRQSLRFDPAIDASHRGIAGAYEMLGRLPDAEAALDGGQPARSDRPLWTQMRARLEIVRQNYDTAVEILAGEPATESTPFAWLVGRVIPLAMASHTDRALMEATRLTDRYPWFCEGQAVAAALEWDHNGKARARTLADAIFTRASAPAAPVQALPCAAIASAAIGDGPRAAGYIAKLASDDRALREWARPAALSLAFSFRRHLYPWNKIESSGPFRQASNALAQRLGRLREETVGRLPATPPQAPDRGPA